MQRQPSAIDMSPFLTSDTSKTMRFNDIGFARYALSNPLMSRMPAAVAAVVTGNANPYTALAGI
jgi:hypothetical protein